MSFVVNIQVAFVLKWDYGKVSVTGAPVRRVVNGSADFQGVGLTFGHGVILVNARASGRASWLAPLLQRDD